MNRIHYQRRGERAIFFLIAAMGLALIASDHEAFGQSGSKRRTGGTARSSTTRQSGSRRRTDGAARPSTATANVGLEGYCPVCVFEMKKWVRGSAQQQVTYDGTTYYFPGPEQKRMFAANPAKYIPALGGDCTVCLVKMGKRVPGNIRYAAFHKQRLFLFPSDEQKAEFRAHPEQYENVDLALDGQCAVCRVEMQKEIPGNEQFTALYHGMRYLFPSAEQRDMFVDNPTRYAIESASNRQSSASDDRRSF